MALTVVEFQLVVLLVWAAQAAQLGRVGAPLVFRPGPRLPFRPLQGAASHRAPVMLYRSAAPHRYAVRHWGSAARGTTRPAARPPGAPPPPARYHLVRAASSPPMVHNDGAIHTIPAPNLSLSEKPIVVLESSDSLYGSSVGEHVKNQEHIYLTRINQPKPTYEVTEKYVEPVYQMAKIETPVGFSKAQVSPELEMLVRHGAALQVAAEYGLDAVSPPAPPPPPPALHYTMQGFHGFPGVHPQQEVAGPGPDVMLSPGLLYQSDPLFLQKLQQQLLQRFPALELVPYAPELVPQNPQPEAPQSQQVFLLENEEIKQPPEAFLSSESKNVVQRDTLESSLVTLQPQAFVARNVTEREEPPSTPPPRNITTEVTAAPAPVSTTVQYMVESSTSARPPRVTEPDIPHNSTPIFYAQIGQSVGNVIANGFYSAVNDVRAAAAVEQAASENAPQTTKAPENVTTVSSIGAAPEDLKQYFIQNLVHDNGSVAELKPLRGMPFAKPADAVKLAYTLVRAEEKQPKSTQERVVFAGQIVEASISEDHDFNNQKASLMKRAPIRLYIADKEPPSQAAAPASSTPRVTPASSTARVTPASSTARVTPASSTARVTPASSTHRVTLVKARIPPKSKLMFDDKTGEPVLRVYASYVDSPDQRKAVTAKLATLASSKAPTPAGADSWAGAAAQGADKSQGFDGNQLTKFGLKLRARTQDYLPLFQEYDD